MNTALLSISLMLIFALVLRIHVVISLFLGAIIGGLLTQIPLEKILESYQYGLRDGAAIALSYGLLGVFSVALSHSGVPQLITNQLTYKMQHPNATKALIKPQYIILAVITLLGIVAETIIPIHIAFIFIFVQPLISLFNQLQMDRRAIACTICFGLVTGYMLFPLGFGNVYLNEILLNNINKSGFNVNDANVFKAMIIPALGMLIGLLIAIFFSYRKKKNYATKVRQQIVLTPANPELSVYKIIIVSLAILVTLIIQSIYGSILLGSLCGILILLFSKVVNWNQANDIFDDGFKMMAMIGLIMISAQGFAYFIKSYGNIEIFVTHFLMLFHYSKPVIIAVLLLIGLFITLGIGSSFSTVPILAAIYVPICIQMNFSPLATIALIGTAGALGDAGSLASDSTLAPSSVLNSDGQHNHLRDTVIPTFIHFNIPLLIAGWIAVMIL